VCVCVVSGGLAALWGRCNRSGRLPLRWLHLGLECRETLLNRQGPLPCPPAACCVACLHLSTFFVFVSCTRSYRSPSAAVLPPPVPNPYHVHFRSCLFYVLQATRRLWPP
jgi:hypothetical protein